MVQRGRPGVSLPAAGLPALPPQAGGGIAIAYTAFDIIVTPDGRIAGSRQYVEERHPTMLEQLLKLYTMSLATKVTSPMPHFVGPPGSGKSSVFQQLADLVGKKLHIVNVSRISPLSLEGVEMPDAENLRLNLLHSPLWTKLREGDIVLLDEFLRGFPEVYNGLLDILTSRHVAGLDLPNVFIAGASNSTVTYDPALEDRLLHIKVPDPRKTSSVRRDMQWRIVDSLGLMPRMAEDATMDELLDDVVLPTYDILDSFDGKGTTVSSAKQGYSLRHVIGQVRMRHVTIPELKSLIQENNNLAILHSSMQHVVLLNAKRASTKYVDWARSVRGSDKLTELQRQNLELNLQLIESEQAAAELQKEDAHDQP